MSLLNDAANWVRAHPGRVVFPDALDIRALKAAKAWVEGGFGRPILLANPFAFREFCWAHGVKPYGISVIDPEHSQLLSEFVARKIEKTPGALPEEIRVQLADPLWFSAMMLSCGEADCCIAGNVSSTASVLRAALKVIGLKEGNKTLSSMFLMVSPDEQEVLGFADCAVVPQPTTDQLADIAVATASSYRNLTGKAPRVAMLSFSSKGSAKHSAAEAVRTATEKVRGLVPELIVDGELQFDAAFVPEVTRQKAPDSQLEGRANVFVFPSLEAGNIGYKLVQRLGGFKALGPMIQGLKFPMHDLSRGCTAEDMLETALLAMKMAGEERSSR